METTVNSRIEMLKNREALSLIDFANKIGVSRMTLHRVLNGAPVSSNLINAICKTFNVSREWLVGGESELEVSPATTVKRESSVWSEKAYESMKQHAEHLEQEVMFLRDMLSNLTKKIASANFNEAFDLAGDIIPLWSNNTVESVRVRA